MRLPIVALVIVMLTNPARGQIVDVSGTVVDESGAGIPGVTCSSPAGTNVCRRDQGQGGAEATSLIWTTLA